MATLQERFDAVCMHLGLSNKDATIRAIEDFVERIEFETKLMEGCGEKHECSFCKKEFDCYYFCGQSMGFQCNVCRTERFQREDNKNWFRKF